MKKKIMPTLHTFEYCDKVETENGKRSFRGLFIHINVLRLPAKHQFFNVVLGFSRGQGKFKGKIVIRNPSKLEITTSEFDIDLNDTKTLFYSVINVENLQLLELGEYTITAYVNGQKIGKREFLVVMERVPEFTDEQIKELLKKEDVAKKGRVVLKCPKCSTDYTFQLNLDPKKPLDKDALEFPPDNRFKCPNDDFEIDLTGIKLTIRKFLGQPRPEKQEGEQIA